MRNEFDWTFKLIIVLQIALAITGVLAILYFLMFGGF